MHNESIEKVRRERTQACGMLAGFTAKGVMRNGYHNRDCL